MRTDRLLTAVAAVAGAAAIAVGVHQGLVHVAPGYEGTIVTGWDGPVNHEERLLARLGAVGATGAVAALRWRRLAAVPAATGGVVLFYALRATLGYARDPGLYTTVSLHGGGPVRLVLGAEPVLLAAGGALLVFAGVRGWTARAGTADGDVASAASS
jgi:hypothetical protein